MARVCRTQPGDGMENILGHSFSLNDWHDNDNLGSVNHQPTDASRSIPMPMNNRPSSPASVLNRRAFVSSAAGAVAGAVAFVAHSTRGAAAERDWSGQSPVRYPDADILVLDPRFDKYKVGNTPIQRLHTGLLWAEGIVWNGVGRY